MCDRSISSVINKLVSCNDYLLCLWTRWFWFWCWFQAVSEEFYRPWCCTDRTEVLCITWQVWWVYWLLTDVLISVVSYVLILLNCNLNLPPDVCIGSGSDIRMIYCWCQHMSGFCRDNTPTNHRVRPSVQNLIESPVVRADQCSDKLLNMLKFLDLSL